MTSVLIVAPSSPKGIPAQATLIGNRLRDDGVDVTLLSKASTSCGRLLDTIFRGFVSIPTHKVSQVNVFGGRAFTYESFAILYASLWQKPVVVMIRGGNFPNFVNKWPRWSRFVLGRATKTLVPHDYLRDELSKLGFRIDGVIPNFIELEKYRFRKRSNLTPRFLYLRGNGPSYN